MPNYRQQLWRLRRCPSEESCIPFLPQFPGDKGKDGVCALLAAPCPQRAPCFPPIQDAVALPYLSAFIVLGSCPQRRQLSWASSPCRSLLSAVQWRRLKASHRNSLIFNGAQVSKTRADHGIACDGRCSASYAERTENCPSEDQRHINRSGESVRWTFSITCQSAMYSEIVGTESLPLICLHQARCCSACLTVCDRLAAAGIMADRVGANCLTDWPSSQLSV